MKCSRRKFIKAQAAASAAAAIGMTIPVKASNVVTDASQTQLKWQKAPVAFAERGARLTLG